MSTRLEQQMDSLEIEIAKALNGEKRHRPLEIRAALERMAVIIEHAKTDQIDPALHATADETYTRQRLAQRRG